MNTREHTNTFAVVDEAGKHRIVKEYTNLENLNEFELAISNSPITRISHNEFVIAGSDEKLLYDF